MMPYLACFFLLVPGYSSHSGPGALPGSRIFRRPYSGIFAVLLGGCLFFPAGLQAQIAFTKHPVDQMSEGIHSVQAADLDGDGHLDLFSASMNSVLWWRNEFASGTWQKRSVTNAFTGARFVEAADLDGDGDLDVFGASQGLDAIMWWENQAGDASTWVEHSVADSFNFAIHVFAADLDNDGDLDLLGAALKDNEITWWENVDGSGQSWNEHVVDDTFQGARHICTLDIDGDGDFDLVGSADFANTIAWWENTGGDATTWVKNVVDSSFDGINAVIPADIDQDGLPDLLGVADDADEIAWWKNVSAGASWVKHDVQTGFDGAVSAVPVDIDKDGDIDVVGAAALDNAINWWENTDGEGTDWKTHTVDDQFERPSFVTAVDIDKDGDHDVIAGSLMESESLLGQIAWWESVNLLPVELTFFDVLVDQGSIHLHWETASETNNAGFVIERATPENGVLPGNWHWTPIDFVEGAGTISVSRSYRHEVTTAEPGKHAFRLKQVDFDGKVEYSPVRFAEMGLEDNIEMTSPYPNPFNPQTKFYLAVSEPQRVKIGVYNTLGQRVALLHDGVLEPDERHQFDFHADQLPGGMYLIRTVSKNTVYTRQVLLVK